MKTISIAAAFLAGLGAVAFVAAPALTATPEKPPAVKLVPPSAKPLPAPFLPEGQPPWVRCN